MVRVWPAGGQAVDAEPESETDAETDAETGTDADTESDAESGTDADTESDAVTAMARIVPVRTALRRRMMNIRGWIVAITLTCEPARCMARKAGGGMSCPVAVSVDVGWLAAAGLVWCALRSW